MRQLSELVQVFVEEQREALALRDAVRAHVERATRRYPDAYFELGRRTPEAVEGLSDRVFTICARVAKGRFPFLGRAPFPAYVEEDFDDPPIRYHTFYAKLSITRELLRDDYAFNIRRDPVLRWRDELHRTVGRALRAQGTPVSAAQGAHQRWTVPAQGPVLTRPLEEVARRLRSRPQDSVESLVSAALRLAGQPLSHSQVTNLLAEVCPPPPPEVPPEEAVHESLPEIMAVRAAVTAAWSELGPAERALIAALARGDDYDTLIARVPELRNRTAVSRAVGRCGQHFVARILRELGHDAPLSPAAAPKAIMEDILHVLLPLLPELDTPTAEEGR